MTKPVGLTRAEEEREHKQPEIRVVVRAPPGAEKCRASVLPDGGACPAAATYRVTWKDGDTTLMCRECALRMEQTAQPSRVDPIRR